MISEDSQCLRRPVHDEHSVRQLLDISIAGVCPSAASFTLPPSAISINSCTDSSTLNRQLTISAAAADFKGLHQFNHACRLDHTLQ